jgi:oxygen-independent coproporphyrinogen-3 oxidase
MVESPDNSLGLYFSVPFCRAKCTYCNFASGVYPASEHGRYAQRLIADLAGAPAWAETTGVSLPLSVDTIYFGGGTPVLLDGALFAEIFAAIRRNFAVNEDAEITVECAPGQLSDETLAAMVEAGVNRVSLGVQSFVDREASLSGRLHTRAMVREDLRRLRAAGIVNLNIDLLAGLAEQTFASWRESLAVLLEAETPHASVYMLEIDEDSRLGRELIAGGARYSAGLVPTDDAIAQMYEEAVATLAGAGLAQYEISNFARLGFESAHNLRYWQRRPYLGVGLDASSMFRSSDGLVLRTTTTDELSAYLDETGSLETAWLGTAQQLEEAWFLGLRRNAGVAIEEIRTEFGQSALEASMAVVTQLVDDGLLMADKQRVRLTDRGRMISNDVFGEFLGLRAGVEESAVRG